MQEKKISINAEKRSIRGKLYTQDPRHAGTLIVYGHGFGGHKDNKAARHFAERLLGKNRDAAVLCFDWPCHGDDAGRKLNLEECDRYLRLVLTWAKDTLAPARLLGLATSFGGYLFLKYTADHGCPFEKLALRCPAVNMEKVLCRSVLGAEQKERLAAGKSVMAGFDRKVEIGPEFLKELRENDLTETDFFPFAEDLLILHGTKDEIIPPAESEAFAERNLIEYIPVEKADHRFSDPAIMDAANAEILRFFGLR